VGNVKHQSSFFDGGKRLQMTESIELTIQSLRAYGDDHPDWGIAWSGGKDSSATLTLICWLIDTGKVHRPRSLTVFYADTRQELPPLAIAAEKIMDELRERGMQEPLFQALRGMMGTENMGQDMALLQTIRHYRAKAPPPAQQRQAEPVACPPVFVQRFLSDVLTAAGLIEHGRQAIFHSVVR
jgi:3'-phosphoadenosine 5'-phosphosulfate sulfotransferase (PAPS reductase)/FAD synthetase